MKHLKKILAFTIFSFIVQSNTFAQSAFEWRINNVVFNSTDPDAGGPATGSVTFTMQIHTRVVGSMIPITGMSTGFCYQTTNAMLPTGVPCSNSIPQPSNITMGASFPAYTFNNINHCSGTVNFTVGGQTFDRRAVGTIDGGVDVNITNTWIDVFTTTLWSKNTVAPQAGYVALNSSNAGNPGPFSNYDLSNAAADVFDANSLSYTTPVALTSSIVPVQFSKFNATCNDKGASIQWATAQEQNTKAFDVEKSYSGNDWKKIASIQAAGNSTVEKSYQYLDINAGAAFYRLKQIDNDGKFTYTSAATTNCIAKNIDVVLYPVPAKDVLNITISSLKNTKATLAIYDATGKQIKIMNENLLVGTNNIQLDLVGFVSGQYILRSIDAGLEINKKFTILK